ncbi:lysophospholipid acyltransferase family protein [Salinarimonas soli]|uniref:1-acyl-sn-glycerol-3-phosphate acyltransferase n=1 Tax=Salinarimonas soli TaxID=1638099 RepID=A0A5B2VD02_9HYPH|nr:lysophospholipid acyltransferase family protein [Salinarimonas soli]KAA2236017.1 1-acyl-sn-glycerol-3-phosphate acyltransferase [Salinarimonas soli]
MLVLRSALFNALYYVNLILWMLAFLPLFVLPRIWFIRVAQAQARSSLWLLRVVAGVRLEVRGRERIPPGGLIVASKHQSLWETFALFTLFDDPAYILKRELMWIPVFGWFTIKGGMVPINRKAGGQALVEMNARAREEVARGRQIIIFPEGTRRAPGAEPGYKYGMAHLYASLGVPILPVALNSGLYWPRRRFIRRPGTIVIEVGEAIPPGLDRDVVFREVQARIEAMSGRLLVEGRRELGLDRSPA